MTTINPRDLPLTVADLRDAIFGLPDDMPVWFLAEGGQVQQPATSYGKQRVWAFNPEWTPTNDAPYYAWTDVYMVGE